MGYKYFVLQQLIHLSGYLFKRWRVRHHIIIDTGKALYKVGYGGVWINQAFIKVDHLGAVMYDYGNFSNAVCCGKTPGCFNIYYSIQHHYNFAQ